MKLNLDCIRDELLYIEENLIFGDTIKLVQIKDALKSKYSEIDIAYTTKKLYEAEFINYIDLTSSTESFNCYISDITMKGHQFLANIHNDKIWEKVKKKIKPFESVSLNIISQLATYFIRSKLPI